MQVTATLGAPLAARFLVPSEWARLDILLAIALVIHIFVEGQMYSAYARHFAQGKSTGRTGAYLAVVGSFYGIGLTALLGIALALASGWLPWNVSLSTSLPVVGWAAAQAVATFCYGVMRLERMRGRFLLITTLDATLGLGALFGVLQFSTSAAAVFAAVAAAKAATAAVALLAIPWQPFRRFKRSEASDLVWFGIPMVPGVAVRWGQQYANRFILLAIVPVAMVGSYGVAARLAAVVLLVDAAFHQAWNPIAARLYERPGAERCFASALETYLVAFIPGILALMLLAPEVIWIFTGRADLELSMLFSLLLVAMLWRGLTSLFAFGNQWSKRTYRNSVASVSGLVAIVALTTLLGLRFGITGAAVAQALGEMTAATVMLITAQRSHHMPFSYAPLTMVALGSIVMLAMIPVAGLADLPAWIRVAVAAALLIFGIHWGLRAASRLHEQTERCLEAP